MTLTLSRLEKENPSVVFIFNLPGLVPTHIHMNSWVSRWAAWLVGISVQDAGERCLWLLSSRRFSCGGMGEGGVLNMGKTSERGSLLCVNSKLEEVQNENVMAKLES
jgi:hypothetical protein